ncbi:sorting nexin-17 [Phymastichus coffea]|uniref:sorting nexin-17 n=1 Tax=Phymastichus coffea TaxID=108790 RepID=UPI00273BAB50|nr:sorting nexin-17 [Phymastichus coffea]XP_058794454.1 sorting nexin-17 [Phymastichus coffea]XP_058794455.1 sorting nexin-17 [Phymastichus coffea]XP_058794456.1 sorting nexin-17 [Phymastichus coffea]
MHFSVPDTQELIDEAGNAYLGYNVHINGLFHCTVRYKQLHNLHEQLSKDMEIPLPPFPPKKFFPLTANQQEDRRLLLDKYIQTIGQNTTINSTELLNGFLLNAQLEGAVYPIEDENLDIFFMNGSQVNLNVTQAENSGKILRKVCKHIKLDDKFHQYFSLFIVYQDEGNFVVIRKLEEFESPIITQRNMHKIETRIILGKWYWNIEFDLDLLQDSIASNLLYNQAVAEVERGWVLTSEEIHQNLKILKEQNQKDEFLKIVRSLRYYGYMQFAPCMCDYPQPGSKVLVSIGKNELNVRITSHESNQEEIGFKVTRMRCWRITTLQEGNDKYEDNTECNLELSFEYLMAKDHLQWITISSEQAILMSVCLQSMIDELLFKSVGGIRNLELKGKSWTYISREGHSRIITGSHSTENKSVKENDVTPRVRAEPIIRKITERFSSAKVRKSSNNRSPIAHQQGRRNGDLLENNAFCMIGDDDL